jgi:hypothetical protein
MQTFGFKADCARHALPHDKGGKIWDISKILGHTSRVSSQHENKEKKFTYVHK